MGLVLRYSCDPASSSSMDDRRPEGPPCRWLARLRPGRSYYSHSMSALRLALAQVNPTLGDLPGNARMIRAWVGKAGAAGAGLVAFPEMVLTGYPVEDLALRRSFVDASRLALTQLATDLVADGFGELPVVLGYLDRADEHSETPRAGIPKGSPQNCAAVLFQGQVITRYAKHHLPNYGVFDEFRIFVSGHNLAIIRVQGIDIALAICEDLWQDGGPVAMTRSTGAELLLVLNGSPYERDKDDIRRELVTRRAAEAGCTLAYVNLVGGQDDLVFDGDSIVVSAEGEVLARGPQFAENLLVVDLELTQSTVEPGPWLTSVRQTRLSQTPSAPTEILTAAIAQPLEPLAEIWQALTTGLRDYAVKNGFSSVLLGLSGGIDSAVVAALAADALGGGQVFGVSMPSEYSSDHSKSDAADLAQRIGAHYRVQPIASMVACFQQELHLTGVAEENLQARVRGVILMGISNSEGQLVLATSNKSELAVGYSTLYGDSVGGYAPLKDVPKTLVWQLAQWRNATASQAGLTPPIPESSISKPPSAELRPGQTDQDSLPPYHILDELLEHYVVAAKGRSELLEAGFSAEVIDSVVTLVDRAEWKRRQFAPGPKISSIAFGRDRRLPITSRWRESDAPTKEPS